MRIGALVVLIFCCLPRSGLTEGAVELIVSRNTQVASVYMRAPAEMAERLLGQSLLPPGATLNEMTFGDAQRQITDAMAELLAEVVVVSRGGRLDVQPLPGLLHRSADPVRFDTPLDGSLSTSVCATPGEPLAPLSELDFLAGWQMELPLSEPGFALVFSAADTDVPIQLRIFERGSLVATQARIAEAGVPLPIGGRQLTPGYFVATFGMAFVGLVVSWWLLFGRGRPRLSRL